jgi:hypothetical protein
VRHEGVAETVLLFERRCQHLLFCQQSPTEACVPGNGEVRSPRHNVSSSFGMAAEARAEAATASTKAVGDQEGVVGLTQVNRCKRRHEAEPKVLTGFDQKVGGQVRGLRPPPAQMTRHRRRGGT